ncbi:MAG: hypothetical protein IKD62_02285 [Oscillospiraceae bacterium]|nr:hypothetical protein [Oscillospiraceae bacterium]MBR3585496.1 hypothetical protein [Oscillospiraceae bacterium]
MRYHYKLPKYYTHITGTTYECDHPVYQRCTLYLIGKKGLAVIQQRYDPDTKSTTWTEIDPWLIDEIYVNKNFKRYFDKMADYPENSVYPTVPVRKIMWALRMKPLPKDVWETVFDRPSV